MNSNWLHSIGSMNWINRDPDLTWCCIIQSSTIKTTYIHPIHTTLDTFNSIQFNLMRNVQVGSGTSRDKLQIVNISRAFLSRYDFNAIKQIDSPAAVEVQDDVDDVDDATDSNARPGCGTTRRSRILRTASASDADFNPSENKTFLIHGSYPNLT